MLATMACVNVFAQNADTLRVFFRQDRYMWEPSFMENGKRMQGFVERFNKLQQDEIYKQISKIHIEAGCSPEGYWEYNQRLSQNRINRIRQVLKSYISLTDSLVVEDSKGINWDGLRKMVENDPDVPFRDEVLDVLDAPEVVKNQEGKLVEVRKLMLKYLQGGKPWRYMYDKFFPTLRNFNLYIGIEWEKFEAAKKAARATVYNPLAAIPSSYPVNLSREYPMPPFAPVVYPERDPFYMGIKTNLLYDAVAVPNIGIEFYLGRNWSATANWAYAWWSHNADHWFWRIYGGELGLRKWFGKAAKEKPLTGHHIGVYGQMFTYDFENGGKGYMGGIPGGTLWDKANYAGGIEYGYALPIAKRLNLDFTIGAGYMGGQYIEYTPADDCYVWQATKQRHWIGPTKAEISLVWLLGHGNINKNKIKGDK